jgi:hypothetical protein
MLALLLPLDVLNGGKLAEKIKDITRIYTNTVTPVHSLLKKSQNVQACNFSSSLEVNSTGKLTVVPV